MDYIFIFLSGTFAACMIGLFASLFSSLDPWSEVPTDLANSGLHVDSSDTEVFIFFTALGSWLAFAYLLYHLLQPKRVKRAFYQRLEKPALRLLVARRHSVLASLAIASVILMARFAP